MSRKSVIWWFWMLFGLFALFIGRIDVAGAAFGLGAMDLLGEELDDKKG